MSSVSWETTRPTESDWPSSKCDIAEESVAAYAHLLRGPSPEVHRRARIDDEMRVEVRLVLVLLHEVAVEFPVGLPVDVPEFVAGAVRPVLLEIDAETARAAPVHATHQALDHVAGAQLEVGQT